MENSEKALSSSLKTRHIVMLSLGGAIGAGLFAGSGQAIAAAGPSVILTYLLAGLILFVIMHGVGQIVLHQKEKSVGMSGLIEPFVGKRFAHFTDWVYWAAWMGVTVAEASAIAQFLGVWFPQVPAWVFVLIVAILTLVINLYSVRAFAETEYWLAWIKVAVIIALIVAGIYLLLTQVFHLGVAQAFGKMNTYGGFAPHGMKGFFNAMLMVIYSYGGSELIAITVSEVEDPKKAIPKAIRGVMLRIVAFYFIPMFLFIELYSWKFLSTTHESPFALVFTKLGIPGAANIINFVIILALFSVINSAIYATSRSLYSRTKNSETKLGKWFSNLSPKGAPLRAIGFSSSLLFVGVILSYIFGSQLFGYLAGSISYTILIVWIMLIVSSLIFYFKGNRGSFIVRVLSILTLLALLVIAYFIVISNPWGLSVFAIIICIASLLSYRKPKQIEKK
jgi:L-asparagine transporter-like permease